MSMELGDPSITSVMSEAEGMATVMLMSWRQRRPALDLGTAH